jgi:hypothetical protein
MTNGSAAGTHHMTDIAVTSNVAVFNDELGFILRAATATARQPTLDAR